MARRWLGRAGWTGMLFAAAFAVVLIPVRGQTPPEQAQAFAMVIQGEQAMQAGNREEAIRAFREALGLYEELLASAPASGQRLLENRVIFCRSRLKELGWSGEGEGGLPGELEELTRDEGAGPVGERQGTERMIDEAWPGELEAVKRLLARTIEERNELREQMDGLRGRISELEQEIAEWTGELALVQERHAEQKERTLDLEADVLELEDKLSTAESSRSALLVELESMRTEQARLAAVQTGAASREAELVAEAEARMLQLGAMEEIKDGLERELAEVHRRLAKATSEGEELALVAEELGRSLVALETELGEALELKQGAEEALAALKREVDDLGSEKGDVIHRSVELAERLDVATRELELMRGAQADVEARLEALQEEGLAGDRVRRELEEMLEEQRVELEGLREHLAAIEDERDAALARWEGAMNEKAELAARSGEGWAEVDSLKGSLESLALQLEELSEERAGLMDRLADAEAGWAAMEAELVAAVAERDELRVVREHALAAKEVSEEAMDRLSLEREELAEALARALADGEALAARLAEVEEARSMAEEERGELSVEVEALGSMITSVQYELSEWQAIAKNAEDRLDVAIRARDEARREVEELLDVRDGLASEVGEVRAELAGLQEARAAWLAREAEYIEDQQRLAARWRLAESARENLRMALAEARAASAAGFSEERALWQGLEEDYRQEQEALREALVYAERGLAGAEAEGRRLQAALDEAISAAVGERVTVDDERLAEVEAALTELRGERDELEMLLEDARAEGARLRAELEDALAREEAARAAVDDFRLSEVEAALADLRREHEALEKVLADERAGREDVAALLSVSAEEHERRLDEARAGMQELRAYVAGLESERELLLATVAGLEIAAYQPAGEPDDELALRSREWALEREEHEFELNQLRLRIASLEGLLADALAGLERVATPVGDGLENVTSGMRVELADMERRGLALRREIYEMGVAVQQGMSRAQGGEGDWASVMTDVLRGMRSMRASVEGILSQQAAMVEQLETIEREAR
ncbi:MAG TPA: hypothetical protein PKE55_09970 [Kiritimatiellia bacterium]|nr:hypothetical protein [Kiritimatiellia bacterium]